MELSDNDHLQALVAKSWDLHGRMSEKLNENGYSFCGNCSNHGRYCVVSEGRREKMVAVRDCLRELHHILVHLQSLRSSQKIQRDEALARLKESRSILIDRINQCSEKEKKLDILKEIMAFIGEGEKKEEFFPWKMEEKIVGNNLNWIWRFVVRFAVEFGVIYAGIYGGVKFCKIIQQDRRLREEGCTKGTAPGAGTNSPREEEMPGFLLSGSGVHLDVWCGRG